MWMSKWYENLTKYCMVTFNHKFWTEISKCTNLHPQETIDTMIMNK